MHDLEQAAGCVTVAHPSGSLDVPVDAVMDFSTPLGGFDQTRFALLPASRRGIWWFISLDDPVVTFVLADPFVASDDYGIDLSDAERLELGLADTTHAMALVLLVMPSAQEQEVTGNFRAPLVFNLAERKVLQIVIRDERYGVAERVDLSRYPLGETGEDA
jgi:flagellar assembly factor FliW